MKTTSKKIDIGHYGYWTVKQPVQMDGKKILVSCLCGTEKYVNIYSLRCGQSRSCGCLKGFLISKSKITHGLHSHPLYCTYRNILARCLNDKNPRAKTYKNRGISVCKEWSENIYSFIYWAEHNGWEKGLTIDRIDNDGNYCPENCRWILNRENNQKRTNSHYITYNGETKNLSQWAKQYGMISKRLEKRLKTGWPVELALTLPAYPYGRGKHESPGRLNRK